MSGRSKETDDSQLSVAEAICHHLDGIAIGSTVSAFSGAGVFELLSRNPRGVNVSSLADQVASPQGYFHVAVRLLAHQGFLKLEGDVDRDETTARLTREGTSWLNHAHEYQQIPRLSAQSSLFSPAFPFATDKFRQEDAGLYQEPPPVDSPDPLLRRIGLHLSGEPVAVAMTQWYRTGLLDRLSRGGHEEISYQDLGLNNAETRFICTLMEAHGWLECSENGAAVTEKGLWACRWAPQYFYPVSYLPLLRRVPEILFGKTHEKDDSELSGMDLNVDRRLDILFSSIVFENTCRNALLETVLPLFDRTPLETQPQAVVDTGSGNGTLLRELYGAIRAHTVRGRMLDAMPLVMVGVEFSKVALEVSKEALETAGVPHQVFSGDIANPSGIARQLDALGIDPGNVLHVSKSVLHNRPFRKPRNKDRVKRWIPLSRGPFVSPRGLLIRPRDLECNLIEFFEDWKPWIRTHGMVVIEAHTVDPSLVSQNIGRNIMTCMDATHGYSHQYLVEADVLAAAAEGSGCERAVYRELSGSSLGKPVLTLSHFRPKP